MEERGRISAVCYLSPSGEWRGAAVDHPGVEVRGTSLLDTERRLRDVIASRTGDDFDDLFVVSEVVLDRAAFRLKLAELRSGGRG